MHARALATVRLFRMGDTSWECTGARLDRLITQTVTAARRRLRRRVVAESIGSRRLIYDIPLTFRHNIPELKLRVTGL